mgnify:CR=1 FL=1
MYSNILLVNQDSDTLKSIKEQLNLYRSSDSLLSVSINDLKKLSSSTNIDLILFSDSGCEHDEIVKSVDLLKRNFINAKIIILLSDFESGYSQDYFSCGVYDIVNPDCDLLSLKIKLRNALMYVALRQELAITRCFLETTSALNPKNGLYGLKNLKECFYSLAELPHVKNGVYAVITIDESVRTKVSINRLSQILQKTLRKTDIIAYSNNKFHIIFGNTTPNYAKIITEKLNSQMGNEFKLHAGVCSVGHNDYETVEKNASDSLKSAINNDLLCVSLTDDLSEDVNWVSGDINSKQFKIFKNAYVKKLKNIIEPLFFRFEKECMSGLKNTIVNQYANEMESVFSLKSNNLHSELVIHYNGFTKLDVKISHSGLETPENTECEYYLNRFNGKSLQKLLKQLKQEYKNYS